MAEKEKCSGELCHVAICCVENGYKISCSYEPEKTMSMRAGWVPCPAYEDKTYVEKTKDAVLKRLKEIL